MRTRLRRGSCLWLIFLFLITGSHAGPASSQSRRELPRSAEHWVERALKRMTLEEKVGQLLMVPYFGTFANTESESYARLLERIRSLHVGGLVVATRSRKPAGFDRSEVYGLARLTNRLQRAAPVPLLIAADFERGANFRVDTATDFPYNMAVGATGDPQKARALGRMAASEARALGVHWLLAPVADVNNNPENPVINIRSFGEDPEKVATMVAAFVEGCEQAGALCTAKHFPGHGDTATDSHLSLPVIPVERERLDSIELVPFRAAIQAGVSAVMPGHLVVPAVEPDPQLSATFSHALLSDLLRRDLGFDGLIISDALTMNAITEEYWPGEAAVRAVEAGVDVVLMSPQPEVAFDALLRAVRSGRLSEARLDQSVRRILEAKARLGLHQETQVDLGRIESVLDNRAFQREAQEIAEGSITLLRDHTNLIPIGSTRSQRGFLLVVSADPAAYPGQALEDEIKPRVDSLLTARTDPLYFTPEEISLPDPAEYDWSLVAVFVRVAAYKGNVALPEEMATLVEQVLGNGKPAALVVLGSPYLVERFPDALTVLCTFSTVPASQRAAVRALFGQNPIEGRLPVSIPNVAYRGSGLVRSRFRMELGPPLPGNGERMAPVHALLDEAVAAGVTAGGVLAVGHEGRLVTLHPFGRLTYEEDARPVEADTLYDLASLTKVVATTTAAMRLYESNRLPLDATAVRYLPELARGPDPEAKRRIEIRHLLTHSSGLPGYLRLYQEVSDRDQLLNRIYGLSLEYPPGTQSVYSDLGIILLGEIIERVSGQPLDQFLRREVFEPLEMNNTLFNPPQAWRNRIAPTERDADFRDRLIRGEVHDENAWVMGGVAPHAGLFSTAGDLAVFCQMLLNGGIYAHRRILERNTIQLFTQRQDIPDSTRALGWDTPSEPPAYSSAGQYFSGHSFGHTGFTGTSIWIDPEKELFVVLLTNRVHPTRENNQIRELRPRLHDAVVEALGLRPAETPTVPARGASRN